MTEKFSNSIEPFNVFADKRSKYSDLIYLKFLVLKDMVTEKALTLATLKFVA